MSEFIKKDPKRAGSCTDCECIEKECRKDAARKSEWEGNSDPMHKEKEALRERKHLKN